MLHITVRLKSGRVAGVLLACLILGILTYFSAGVPLSTARAQQAPQSTFTVNTSGRHFYLTQKNYFANTALTACGSGYHMASLWEILDVSYMTYDYNKSAAYVQNDSGYGPPSNWNGWIHTGYSSSAVNVSGQGNCLSWTSTSGGDDGTIAKLSHTWVINPGTIAPWITSAFTCGGIAPVWCVGDFFPT